MPDTPVTESPSASLEAPAEGAGNQPVVRAVDPDKKEPTSVDIKIGSYGIPAASPTERAAGVKAADPEKKEATPIDIKIGGD